MMRSFLALAALLAVATPAAATCTIPDVNALPPFNITSLEGSWRVISGHNRAFDCYKCMDLSFHNGIYNFSYIVDGGYTMIPCTITQGGGEGLPQVPITIDYQVNGLHGEDHWYILAVQDGYVFVYYCGALEGIHYEGATIIHKEPAVMPADVEATMTKAAAGVNLTLSTFCTVDNDGCTN